MKKQIPTGKTIEPVQVTEAEDGCSLDLSADGKWMRLNVSGKLIAAFHVDYVQKVMSERKSAAAKPTPKRRELPANL